MIQKKKLEMSNISNEYEAESDENDSDSSDVSMTDSSEDEAEETQQFEDTISDENEITNEEQTTQEEEEEEEDEVVKAIKRENQKQRDHPPVIHCDDFITDICFHPKNDLLAVASISGDVLMYKYTNEANELLNTLELHTKACRDIEFSENGDLLFSVAKDKSIMITDVATEKLVSFFDEAHSVPIYRVAAINENLITTGDDDGTVKLWDLRRKQTPVFTIKKNEDYISDFMTNEQQRHLVCSSGDGSLTTIDLAERKLLMQSEEYEEELTCLGTLKHESKLISGSSKGKLFVYNWGEFGLHCDEFAGAKTVINSLIPITENIIVTACEDGNLRATWMFPNRHLGIVGQHDMSIEKVDICNNGNFIASYSHGNDIRFWNIQYFEDFEKVSNKHKKHEKKKEMKNHLPSSNRRNASEFFSDL